MDPEVVSGEPIRYQTPAYSTDEDNWIECVHGYSGDDYLWHISPRRARKQWKVSSDLVITHLAYVMSHFIPSSVEVKIWAPYMDWDIKEITFRAVGLKDSWAFDENKLPDVVQALLKKGNELV